MGLIRTKTTVLGFGEASVRVGPPTDLRSKKQQAKVVRPTHHHRVVHVTLPLLRSTYPTTPGPTPHPPHATTTTPTLTWRRRLWRC